MKNELKRILSDQINSGKVDFVLSELEGKDYLKEFSTLLSFIESKPRAVEVNDLSEFLALVEEMPMSDLNTIIKAVKVRYEEAKESN